MARRGLERDGDPYRRHDMDERDSRGGFDREPRRRMDGPMMGPDLRDMGGPRHRLEMEDFGISNRRGFDVYDDLDDPFVDDPSFRRARSMGDIPGLRDRRGGFGGDRDRGRDQDPLATWGDERGDMRPDRHGPAPRRGMMGDRRERGGDPFWDELDDSNEEEAYAGALGGRRRRGALEGDPRMGYGEMPRGGPRREDLSGGRAGPRRFEREWNVFPGEGDDDEDDILEEMMLIERFERQMDGLGGSGGGTGRMGMGGMGGRERRGFY